MFQAKHWVQDRGERVNVRAKHQSLMKSAFSEVFGSVDGHVFTFRKAHEAVGGAFRLERHGGRKPQLLMI